MTASLTPPRAIGLVGAGLASARAAETLRSLGYDGRLVLIGDEPHAPYDRPPLSKDALLTPTSAPQDLLAEPRIAELGLELVLGDRVATLEPDAGRLTLASGGRVDVDRVLLATGGRARPLPVPGAGLAQVSLLRTRDDAERVRELVHAGGPAVVIGGGFVGLEVAAAARAVGVEVTVVEAGQRLLGRVLPAATAVQIERAHRAAGINFELGTGVAEIVGTDAVQAVRLTDGRHLAATSVVVGIGMTPAVELALDAGLEVADGVVTDAAGRTGHPRVFAAGDVARSVDPWYGALVRLEQWQSAQNQGVAAAHAMLGLTAPAPAVPWFWSDQGDVRLQVAGVPERGEAMVHRGSPEGIDHCTLHLCEGRVVAAVALGRPRDIRGATQLIESGVRAAPALLADESTDLRRLAKELVLAG